MRNEVVITGIGLVTPLGESIASFADGLFNESPRFSTVTTRYARPLPGARVRSDIDVGLSRGENLLADRSTRFALQAAERALQDAGCIDRAALHRCGVFVGCGSGPTEALNAAYTALLGVQRMQGLTLLRCLPGAAAGAIAIRYGMRGPTQTYTSACASSTQAIGEALRAIRHGYLDMALVGGTETPFGDVTLKAWEALRVLAPQDLDVDAACRPFDKQRRGLVLGEGSVFFVLESERHAHARGATPRAQLTGYGTTGDGHHFTEPCSAGQVSAIRQALDDAQLGPNDVAYINAHGTGTTIGDIVESDSIANVFGAHARGPWVSSTKSAHGHLLGASGAIEMAACIATLQSGRIPRTRNLRERDPACGINLAQATMELPKTGAVLSNSFAFGGSNACLVMQRASVH